MFIETLMIYIASLSGVFLKKFTKNEVKTHLKYLIVLEAVFFILIAAFFILFNYSKISLWILFASSLAMFFINYIPHSINWSFNLTSYIDMIMQNIPMGFVLSANMLPFMFAYYILESSIFSVGKKLKTSLLLSAYSMIPFVIGVIINFYFAIPLSITAGLLVFFTIKKSIIAKENWKEK